jgi:SAM-dependent methyltransferase
MGDGERAMATLDLLTSPAGCALLAELRGVEVRPGDELRLAERLRREHSAELVTAALAQHELRRRGAAKFSRADAMWFTRDGLEQASAERVARHRAVRYAGHARVADLCCGIGGDLVALAARGGAGAAGEGVGAARGGADTAGGGAAGGRGAEVLAVDRDPVHLYMALLNAAAHRVAERVHPVRTDVRDVALAGVDAVFVDPARRTGGPGAPGRSRRLRSGETEPPLAWCAGLTEVVPAVGVKAAPGLDRELVPPGWEVEFVADGRELKEAVLWSPALAGATTRATVLPGGHQLRPEPGAAVPVRAPGEFLLDPNPAVTRAGLVEELARRLCAWKIDPMIAFLSADRPVHTPFGRSLRVLDHGPWREKNLAARLRAHQVGALDIRRRGLAGDTDTLRRRLRPALSGGTRPATLVMTRMANRPWALVCVDA